MVSIKIWHDLRQKAVMNTSIVKAYVVDKKVHCYVKNKSTEGIFHMILSFKLQGLRYWMKL
jgi:hypothetical protein